MELSTENILSLFQTDKNQRLSFVNHIMESLENGTADPLKVHLQIRSMEDIINSLTNTDPKKNKHYQIAMQYKKLLLDEAEKNGKKFTLHNAEFSLKEVGTKYNYDQCNDEVILNLHSQQKALDASVKEQENYLRNLPLGGTDIVTPDGEKVRIYPPSKSSTTAVTVQLK